jgi:hypothetical protein
VNALATCSSQARECEEPLAKRQCGASTELAALDDAQNDVGQGSTADAQPRDETSSGGVRASSEVAQSTNLKRARNVGGCKQTKKL